MLEGLRPSNVVVGVSPGVVALVEATNQAEPGRDEPNPSQSSDRLTTGFGYFCDPAPNWLKPDL